MRILQISYNHHVVGGSDRVFLETSAVLARAGHEVIPFCLSSPKDLPTPWASYFPHGADTSRPRARDTARYFYNIEARRCLERLLDDTGPIDVAHIHIYHGKLTTAILPILKARGIPIVQTLHEYKLACPVYTMQRNGENCDACVGNSVLPSIRHRCKDGSLVKSTVMAAEMVFSRLLGDVRLIDRFICVSGFQREVMIRAGLPEQKLTVLHNFVEPAARSAGSKHGDYLLYMGRIEPLKGVPTLLDAAVRTGQRLILAGEGSWSAELTSHIRRAPNITRVGFQEGAALAKLVASSKAVVVPSEWYENCPMSVLEAKAAGKPVVAARIGGIPELVRDGVDGFLFKPGSVEELCEAFARLEASSQESLSDNALDDAAGRFSAMRHLAGLIENYAQAGVTMESEERCLAS